MKPTLHPTLINDPLGDPGLLVQFLFERRAMLFDMGDLSRVANVDLLKVSHVFVSHTHIDHFIGFDRLLRSAFGRGKTVRFFGPENFIQNVEGKLAGFTWNLVDRYEESITLEVFEVHNDHIRKATFRAVEKFKRQDEKYIPLYNGVLWEEHGFTVSCAILEHRVPCLGFVLEEAFHVNINKDRLESMGLAPGRWLTQLKQHVFEDAPDDLVMEAEVGVKGHTTPKQFTLEELKRELVTVTEGQKIAYVVDTVYNDTNKQRIIDLVRGVDVFYCESPFTGDEEERGRERCHLTSVQAGILAREAGVKQLRTFHYSPRHTDDVDRLRQEAQDAFQGK